MVYHILNGDCLLEQLTNSSIEGEFIVCREALIDGPLYGNSLSDFWKTRAKFIHETYNESNENYSHKVIKEFEKILHLPNNAEVYLWFENDLFCQVNMWFVLSLLAKKKVKIYRIFPVILDPSTEWKGFGLSTSLMLEKAYTQRIEFFESDISLGLNLWNAYKENNFNKLSKLASSQSNSFQYLKEVCQAHIDRKFGKLEKVIREIIDSKSKEFNEVFDEFSKREGIYGLGDMQVKKIWENVIKNNPDQ